MSIVLYCEQFTSKKRGLKLRVFLLQNLFFDTTGKQFSLEKSSIFILCFLHSLALIDTGFNAYCL